MENVFLVVGLGNPGREYAATRHNAGFLLVERMAARWNGEWALEKKFEARVAKVRRGDARVILCQPQTFMNASGVSVKSVADFFRLPQDGILIAVDDADLPLGEIRLRSGGSSGGHHGLESVEEHLGSRDFARLRLGIGRRDGARRITGYVLENFEAGEMPLVEEVLVRAVSQVECWVRDGIDKAMSQFNGVINKKEIK